MATKKSKYSALAVRLAPEIRVHFQNKASKYGGAAYVLRELVIAFNEDRVKIAPPKPGELFNVE